MCPIAMERTQTVRTVTLTLERVSTINIGFSIKKEANERAAEKASFAT